MSIQIYQSYSLCLHPDKRMDSWASWHRALSQYPSAAAQTGTTAANSGFEKSEKPALVVKKNYTKMSIKFIPTQCCQKMLLPRVLLSLLHLTCLVVPGFLGRSSHRCSHLSRHSKLLSSGRSEWKHRFPHSAKHGGET